MVGRAEVMRVRTSLGERGEKEVSVWVNGGTGDPVVTNGESEFSGYCSIWYVRENGTMIHCRHSH